MPGLVQRRGNAPAVEVPHGAGAAAGHSPGILHGDAPRPHPDGAAAACVPLRSPQSGAGKGFSTEIIGVL